MLKFENTKNFEAKIFALLLLFLPVNLAKHFIFNFCYVDGILVDYLIPTIYLTDIFVVALLLLWLFKSFKKVQYMSIYSCTVKVRRPFVTLGLGIIAVSGFSILQAQNQPAAVYRWLKLVEYVLFALYVSKNVDLKKDFSTIVKLLSIGVFFESILAVAQWFKQGSIFGYWFLGENKYTVSTPGIATFDFFGAKKIRSYGTFPHPNVLGGYLAVVLPWIFYAGLKGVKEIKERFTIYDFRPKVAGSARQFATLVLGLTALFFSFSRSAWLVGVLGLLGQMFGRFPLSFYSLLPSAYSLSFLRRAELNWIALEMIKDHPLLGVGLNNFTVAMGQYGKVSGWTRFLQPAHNVYLLLAAETGFLGLAAFLLLLLFTINDLRLTIYDPFRRLLLVSLSQIFLLCFVDHYFFTLQQTSLLFWLLVGLVFLEYNQKGNDVHKKTVR